MTGTQLAKVRRSTPEYKAMIKLAKQEMLSLKSNGKDFDHLAVCPDTYALYLKIKY